MDRTYAILLRAEPEGGFTVLVPALREIVTYGENEQDALAMAKDAIELCIAHRRECGEEVPEGDATAVRLMAVSVAG
jgi:antitoxin HicB